jgi:hypothetical protein
VLHAVALLGVNRQRSRHLALLAKLLVLLLLVRL